MSAVAYAKRILPGCPAGLYNPEAKSRERHDVIRQPSDSMCYCKVQIKQNLIKWYYCRELAISFCLEQMTCQCQSRPRQSALYYAVYGNNAGNGVGA